MNKRDWNNHPPLVYPDYKSTVVRNPAKPLIPVPEEMMDLRMPVYGDAVIDKLDHDLTKNSIVNGEPLGERIVIHGKVIDEQGRGIPNVLVEIWQCNSTGRYIHKLDQHDAPLDPNFVGAGRALTDDAGNYRFYTIKPGAYPWGNHPNAWRPAHIHFSLFGHQFADRLITQMYFPGDPLFAYDPIFNSVPAHARDLLVADFKIELTEPGFALGYEFNIVLRGSRQTPFE
ncbi:protocatechuate 3,4-dioxygenase subunit beta [Flavilitoribacter nigricans]|uniref:Protocatechuate 3,4-dioxygenase subunit beta n=1 Tax=Flavilitoribacter nigricans (strain ATCC 23147 / DSM 23189 / NBRC 102662 / NCIMB 1420 / SS-2) TaxID=1122177 RepID=A0A2D0N072_FLAN2|nr:protocatechuate 3,4-dioxygenase subunit beta [Flavilitoribacter nigricans]PHN01914.1 protocatechuate 3,4-dioxygenase subunit beta [Flavilitoribacter nigricans DSM 23189 = NBRC 102662]